MFSVCLCKLFFPELRLQLDNGTLWRRPLPTNTLTLVYHVAQSSPTDGVARRRVGRHDREETGEESGVTVVMLLPERVTTRRAADSVSPADRILSFVRRIC